jgi:hypothetical protein
MPPTIAAPITHFRTLIKYPDSSANLSFHPLWEQIPCFMKMINLLTNFKFYSTLYIKYLYTTGIKERQ